MGFYSDLMEFYSDLMEFYNDSMGYSRDIPSGKLTVCYGSHGPFSSMVYLLKLVIFYSYVK